jgi:CHAD domain-containing protein
MSAGSIRGRSAGKMIHRIINRRIKRIHKELAAGDSGESIHDARKEIKKIRATLRLARGGLGHKEYQKLHSHFQEAGRALSTVRDAAVLAATANKIRRGRQARSASSALSKLCDDLNRCTNECAQCLAASAECLSMVRSAATEKIPWRRVCWRHLHSGLLRSCKRSRAAFKAAKETPSAENLHEWRKRSKDLLYQLCIVKRLSPRTISHLIKCFKHLTEDLGDFHDLVMLDRALAKAGLDAGERIALEEIINARCDKLRRAAFALGKKAHTPRISKLIKKISCKA